VLKGLKIDDHPRAKSILNMGVTGSEKPIVRQRLLTALGWPIDALTRIRRA
jgi:hypothetical protein